MQIDEINKKIVYSIPLTSTSGKIRIKERSMVFEYGLPFASKQKHFHQKNYVEWQIGYDALLGKDEEKKNTSLHHIRFLAYNKKEKYFYELSEILFHFVKWGLISKVEIINLENLINSFDLDKLIESNKNFNVERSHPKEVNVLGTTFQESIVKYPLLVYKHQNFDVIAEVIIKEKQRAVGTQAMLYLCFPITELQDSEKLLGRCAKTKEVANFVFNESKKGLILEIIKVFAMLSKSHRIDVLAILMAIKNSY